jgi:NTP pyrophosphatase (non-canonical NTP hydrolase)
MNKLAKQITEWRKSRGFYTPASLKSQKERDAMLGKLMLVVSEVAEAAKAVRHNDGDNFREEIADTFIRLLDICGAQKINIEKAIADKMKINMTRELLHGKKCSL